MAKHMDLCVFFQIIINYVSVYGKNKKVKEKTTFKYGILVKTIMKDKLQQKILFKL